MIYAGSLEIGSNRSRVIAKGSTPSGLMINGGCASVGMKVMPTMSKSLTTIERTDHDSKQDASRCPR